VFGLIDTYALSRRIHERFYVGYHTVKLPHKFKIGVGGCPNNCVKPDLNDVGVIGAWVPSFVAEKCVGCGACAKACPLHIATVENANFTTTDACNACGRCVRACKTGALEYTPGYRVTLGGRWGKQVARGTALSRLFATEDEVIEVIEKIILFFRAEGQAGERLADTVARVGFENAERMILSDELLARKDEILEKAL
jgi:dissimilatory sulfite reductase (desulfoviridin) alpha/beta subunit